MRHRLSRRRRAAFHFSCCSPSHVNLAEVAPIMRHLHFLSASKYFDESGTDVPRAAALVERRYLDCVGGADCSVEEYSADDQLWRTDGANVAHRHTRNRHSSDGSYSAISDVAEIQTSISEELPAPDLCRRVDR